MNANELYLAVIATYTPYQLVSYFSLTEERQKLIGPCLSQLGISFDESVPKVVELLKDQSSSQLWKKIVLNEQHMKEISRLNAQELRKFVEFFDKDEEQIQLMGYVLVDNMLDLLAQRAIELGQTQGHPRWFEYLITNQTAELTIQKKALGTRDQYAYF